MQTWSTCAKNNSGDSGHFKYTLMPFNPLPQLPLLLPESRNQTKRQVENITEGEK